MVLPLVSQEQVGCCDQPAMSTEPVQSCVPRKRRRGSWTTGVMESNGVAVNIVLVEGSVINENHLSPTPFGGPATR